MKKVIKSLYGSIALHKSYCPKCKKYSFIQDNKLACCDYLISELPNYEFIKRESEGETFRSIIPLKVRKEVLQKQENKCIYCDINLINGYIWNVKRSRYQKVKIHFDHFISWNYSRNNEEQNIVASCDICNHIKYDKYFPDIISAREYILEKRQNEYLNY